MPQVTGIIKAHWGDIVEIAVVEGGTPTETVPVGRKVPGFSLLDNAYEGEEVEIEIDTIPPVSTIPSVVITKITRVTPSAERTRLESNHKI